MQGKSPPQADPAFAHIKHQDWATKGPSIEALPALWKNGERCSVANGAVGESFEKRSNH